MGCVNCGHFVGAVVRCNYVGFVGEMTGVVDLMVDGENRVRDLTF